MNNQYKRENQLLNNVLIANFASYNNQTLIKLFALKNLDQKVWLDQVGFLQQFGTWWFHYTAI